MWAVIEVCEFVSGAKGENGISTYKHLTVSVLQMGTLVLWGTPDVSFAVPLWVIILAILLGLLVLAMLTLAMWKVHTVHTYITHHPQHSLWYYTNGLM